ncbi:MAG: TlyA family RNA methyltransferase, partial [Mycoplasmoidaceae bacterium]|nr:TlyA family RNA methyltransferase [Mycoplasmoidaceae bacterium]
PQYEINDIKIKNFNGVIKDEKIRQKIIQKVSDYFIKSGFQVIGITPSPITGKKGNIEYLIYVKK